MTAIRVHPSSLLSVGAAAGAGTAAGGLTAYLQGVVPPGWSTVVNSGAVWTVVAFAVAAVAARSLACAVTAGLLALLGEVAGYYLYLALVLHVPAAQSEQVLWTMAALWIGPLTGWAAFAARWGRVDQRMTALAGLAGLVAGEGGHLIRRAGLPSAGWVEIGLASLLAAGALTSRPAPARARFTAAAIGTVTAGAVYLAYGSRLFA